MTDSKGALGKGWGRANDNESNRSAKKKSVLAKEGRNRNLEDIGSAAKKPGGASMRRQKQGKDEANRKGGSCRIRETVTPGKNDRKAESQAFLGTWSAGTLRGPPALQTKTHGKGQTKVLPAGKTAKSVQAGD